MEFEYDTGSFLYFLLSFEALIVLPATYYFYPRSAAKNEKRDTTQCGCEKCCIKESRLRQREPYRKAKQRLIKLVLIIGWITLLLTFYKITHLKHEYIAYDPFEILEIDQAASMADIKKAYRRLSLIHHPDKETGEEKKFMMIAKAYAALTDEEAKKNWQVYGNPDGPGAMTFGIALPSWIVEKENAIIVLGLYSLVFMVALPVCVGIWWYSSVKFNGENSVLIDTTSSFYFFIHKTPHMVLKRIIMIIAASSEFDRKTNREIIERSSDNIEVPLLIKELPNLGEKNKERPLCFGYSLKARALLHAHLSRMKLPATTLDEDKNYVVKKCPSLLHEFVQCASSLTTLAIAGKIPRMPSLDTIESAMKLCSLIVQAQWDVKSPLLQLPHVSDDILRHFTSRKRNIRGIRNLAIMKDDDRRAMLRCLNDDEYANLVNVISTMPLLEVEVKSEVIDDEDSCTITAGAIVTCTAFLTRKSMSALYEQEEKEKAENEIDEMHDDEGQPLQNGDVKAKKSKGWLKSKKKKNRGASKAKKKNVAVKTSNVSVKKANGGIVPNSKADISELATKKNTERDSDSVESGSSGESDAEGEIKDNESNSGSDEPKKNDDVEDAEWENFREKLTKRNRKALDNTKTKKSHCVHCPYFPEVKNECWWVYLADKKRHALISVPYLVTSLVDTEEVELKFSAPQKPGLYSYSVVVRSDSYIDFDVVKTIKLDVKEAKQVDLTKIMWMDASEEEEEKDEEESAVEDSDLASDDESDSQN